MVGVTLIFQVLASGTFYDGELDANGLEYKFYHSGCCCLTVGI